MRRVTLFVKPLCLSFATLAVEALIHFDKFKSDNRKESKERPQSS